jgi:hypothetical protein
MRETMSWTNYFVDNPSWWTTPIGITLGIILWDGIQHVWWRWPKTGHQARTTRRLQKMLRYSDIELVSLDYEWEYRGYWIKLTRKSPTGSRIEITENGLEDPKTLAAYVKGVRAAVCADTFVGFTP